MSAVPRSIQRQAEAAAQIEQAIAAEQAQASPPLQAEPPAFEPPANPDPPPELSAPPAEPPPPSPPAHPAEPDKDWKHLYKTMQGMYNSHVPRLQVQVEDLTREINALRAEKAAKPAEPPAAPVVDPKDAETFGADLVEMVNRQAQRLFEQRWATVQPELDRVKKLETRVESTGQTVQMTAEQTFWRDFEQLVPDWETVNAREDFRTWLNVKDPVYDERPQDALEKAQTNFNARRAAQVFMTWKSLQAPPAPPAVPAKPSLEKQVTPNAGGTTPPPPPSPNAEIITSKQIERFYNEMAQGKWRNRAQEAAAIEARINQALAEGRVR